MGLLVTCPRSASLPNLPVDSCPESLGQIQKVIFQRIFVDESVKNKFVIATNDPKEKASWTALLAAADSTKVVTSPYILAPATEPGAARTYGGGNETLGGVEIVIGREPTSFTANISRAKQSIIETLKKFQGENIGVFLIDEYGRIAGLTDDHDTPTTLSPIPIQGLFVGDKSLGGLEDIDKNVISWKFFPNWSDKLVIVVPEDFNALSDLVNP